jgi:hypothetical protein
MHVQTAYHHAQAGLESVTASVPLFGFAAMLYGMRWGRASRISRQLARVKNTEIQSGCACVHVQPSSPEPVFALEQQVAHNRDLAVCKPVSLCIAASPESPLEIITKLKRELAADASYTGRLKEELDRVSQQNLSFSAALASHAATLAKAQDTIIQQSAHVITLQTQLHAQASNASAVAPQAACLPTSPTESPQPPIVVEDVKDMESPTVTAGEGHASPRFQEIEFLRQQLVEVTHCATMSAKTSVRNAVQSEKLLTRLQLAELRTKELETTFGPLASPMHSPLSVRVPMKSPNTRGFGFHHQEAPDDPVGWSSQRLRVVSVARSASSPALATRMLPDAAFEVTPVSTIQDALRVSRSVTPSCPFWFKTE